MFKAEFYIAHNGHIDFRKDLQFSFGLFVDVVCIHKLYFLLYVIRCLSAGASLTFLLQANDKLNTVPSCWLFTKRIQMPNGCFIVTIAMLTKHLLLHDNGYSSELYCTNVKLASHHLEVGIIHNMFVRCKQEH